MKKKFTFNKSIYSKEALLKASYAYIDNFYMHLDENVDFYIVEIEPKNQYNLFSEDEFKNEMLIQETRKIVAEKTHKLREIIYSRAMASTVIDDTDMITDQQDEEVEGILVNWFDKYDK